MHLWQDQFHENHDFPRAECPTKILVIAATPRCGSHMLGHALRATGCFGFPLEYVNPANLARWKGILGTKDLPETLREIQHRRTSPNGVFAIKLHYSHIRQFGDFGRLQEVLPEAFYVFLRRADVLKQAVSLAIAQQTGVWISGQPATNDTPQYDFDRIDDCLRRTLRDNASWRYVLAANGCKVMEIRFSEVRADPAASIRRIAVFMGLAISPDQIPNEHVTRRQGDGTNSRWEARYLSEFRDRELFGTRSAPFIIRARRQLKKLIPR